MAELTTKYTLELEEIEAYVLLAILGKINGVGVLRQIASDLYTELSTQDLVDSADYVKISGTLTFEEQ